MRGAAIGRAPTILQNGSFYARISNFVQSPIVSATRFNDERAASISGHLKVGLGIFDFCAISRRLISKIRFPHPISVADAICGTRFDLRDSKRRALED